MLIGKVVLRRSEKGKKSCDEDEGFSPKGKHARRTLIEEWRKIKSGSEQRKSRGRGKLKRKEGGEMGNEPFFNMEADEGQTERPRARPREQKQGVRAGGCHDGPHSHKE